MSCSHKRGSYLFTSVSGLKGVKLKNFHINITVFKIWIIKLFQCLDKTNCDADVRGQRRQISEKYFRTHRCRRIKTQVFF